MIEVLRRPMTRGELMLSCVGVSAAVAVYCLAYSALAGRTESVGEALAWAAVNVLPWLAAFDAAKRAPRLRGKVLALAGGLAASLALGSVAGDTGGPGFELVRRVPGLLLTAALLAAVGLSGRRDKAESAELPLVPAQIDWIAAAGNYVELHGRGRTVIHRAPLSRLEAELSPHGFVRIHRSILVRRERIARVRSQDVILADGTSLKLGKRFRARLAA